MMLTRRLLPQIELLLAEFPAVALLGPRQVGKTTLALAVGDRHPHVYLDLETVADQTKLGEAEPYLERHADKLVILDEVQKLPKLFPLLRGAIDRQRRQGAALGRFLLLGSASRDLLQQSGESLAGRIAYLELAPFDALEAVGGDDTLLWTRGGFPNSFLARSDAASLRWRQQFIRTYIERDIPQLGPKIPAASLRRFWTMLAHIHGGLLNAASLAQSLAVDGKTVARYLDLMVDLMLVRRLAPLHGNVGKRLVKAPKVFVRDSGIVHALLGIADNEAVLSHPVAGASWEGHVLENLIAAIAPGGEASFYRTSAGAEVDLVLDLADGRRIAVEIKRSRAPTLTRGAYLAFADVAADARFVVYAGEERYLFAPGIEAIGLREMMKIVGG